MILYHTDLGRVLFLGQKLAMTVASGRVANCLYLVLSSGLDSNIGLTLACELVNNPHMQALIDKCGFTQEEVATSVGKSRPAITNALRLLRLPEEVRQMTKDGDISAGHARALLAFDNEPMMLECAKQIVDKKLTVRDVEKMAKRPKTSKIKASSGKARDSFYDEVELALSDALGTKVKVYNGRNKGTLEIEFYTLDDHKNIANAIAK